LALPLLQAQPADQRGADDQAHDQRRQDRAAGAGGDVVKQIEKLKFVRERSEEIL
jgi:hypothetical protein